MNKDSIKKEYKKKIKSLNYYNKKYYSDNISAITDSEYDDLKKDLKRMYEKHNKPNNPVLYIIKPKIL